MKLRQLVIQRTKHWSNIDHVGYEDRESLPSWRARVKRGRMLPSIKVTDGSGRVIHRVKMKGVNLWALYDEPEVLSRHVNPRPTLAVVYRRVEAHGISPKQCTLVVPRTPEARATLLQHAVAASLAPSEYASYDVHASTLPHYSAKRKSYVLRMNDPGAITSVKNFNIRHDETKIYQLARHENNRFRVQFRQPVTSSEAFAVAMTRMYEVS